MIWAADASLASHRTMREIFRADGITSIIYWQNGIPYGGACDTPANRAMAALLLGID